MSMLTLVRHGQASLFADNYDELSLLGQTQARLLGEFWARRQIDFDYFKASVRLTCTTGARLVVEKLNPRDERRLRPAQQTGQHLTDLV